MPEELDAFGAGFSRTSLSSLNGEAQANVSAMAEGKVSYLQRKRENRRGQF